MSSGEWEDEEEEETGDASSSGHDEESVDVVEVAKRSTDQRRQAIFSSLGPSCRPSLHFEKTDEEKKTSFVSD